MELHSNKKGMYEYILTKSIMLIFILGLVYVFYNFYNNLNVKSAGDVAEYEADRIAKIIDDAISYTGIETENTIILNNNLKVGRTLVGYDIVIDRSKVVLTMNDYPYQDIIGVGIFGQSRLQVDDSSGSECFGRRKEQVECIWGDIVKGAMITVRKNDEWYYVPNEGLYYKIRATIDGTEDCGDILCLAGDWPVEGDIG